MTFWLPLALERAALNSLGSRGDKPLNASVIYQYVVGRHVSCLRLREYDEMHAKICIYICMLLVYRGY